LTKACFTNQGQVCVSCERIYIERPIFDKVVEAWKKHLDEYLVVGDPRKSNYGSMIGKFHRNKVEECIEMAKKAGGKIEWGGTRPKLPEPFDKGAYLLPTLISGLDYRHEVCCKEVFGPFVTLHPFDSEDEALKMTNNLNLGLSSSVWTSNVGKAHRMAGNIQAGMVWVNGWGIRDPRVPFGGIKNSGIGAEGGMYSIDFYTTHKNICINVEM